MTARKLKKVSNHGATILGILTGIAQAWITIDWANFNIDKEYPKLLITLI